MFYLEHKTWIDSETGFHLVWSNEHGWVDQDPTFFSLEETKQFLLIPEGSQWKQIDDLMEKSDV